MSAVCVRVVEIVEMVHRVVNGSLCEPLDVHAVYGPLLHMLYEPCYGPLCVCNGVRIRCTVSGTVHYSIRRTADPHT